MNYANLRNVDYDYTDAVDDIMSRLMNITTDGESTANAVYIYPSAGCSRQFRYPDLRIQGISRCTVQH